MALRLRVPSGSRLWILIVLILAELNGRGSMVRVPGQPDRGCEPLARREGVRLRCSSFNEGGSQHDCHKTQLSRVAVGTVVYYGCEAPFYVALQRELMERERRLVCNAHGKWTGGLNRFHIYSCTLNCGVIGLGASKTFIQGGTVAKQTDWPWHALIFVRIRARDNEFDDKFEYKCGGSLIQPYGASEFVVVTAAHCVASLRHADGAGTHRPSDVRLVVGAEESRLDDIHDHSPEAQTLNVAEIILHRSYDSGFNAYQADIALIRLAAPPHLVTSVLPVCLSGSVGKPSLGDVGHLAGVGAHEKGTRLPSTQLRRASFPVVTSEHCEMWQFRKLLPDEFCAGRQPKARMRAMETQAAGWFSTRLMTAG